MNMEEVIENELKCVQRNCCRLENECAKCDLVLPIEEIINAYNEALRIKKENAELKAQIEKMKCCGNCSKNGHICVAEEMQGKLCGKNKDKWQLRN